MSTTYLQIVNNTIQEAGVDSASFAADGSDFTTNPNILMNRFQMWVSRAWKDIQQEAYDWDMMEEQAVVNIDPGFMFYTDGTPISAFQSAMPTGTQFSIFDQDTTVAVPQLTVDYIQDITGNRTLNLPFGVMTLQSSSTPLNFGLKPAAEYFDISYSPILNSGDIYIGGWGATNSPPGSYAFSVNGSSGIVWASGMPTIPVTCQVVVTNGNGSFVFDDDITITSYNPSTFEYQGTINSAAAYNQLVTGTGLISITFNILQSEGNGIAYIHSWKSFDFENGETQNRDFVEDVQEIDGKSFRLVDFFKEAPVGEVPLQYIPWEVFRTQYDLTNATPGIPRVVTKDDTNRWKFYPHPYYTMTVKFDYIRQPQILVAFGDIPRGINDDFVDIIMWRALIYFGDFDEQPSVSARATKNYKTLLSRLEQKNRPKFHFLPHRMW